MRRWAASPGAVFVGGEPGVGKSRFAAELAAHAHAAGAVVLYGRCDEDLAAALQPFVEALRPLVPALGADRLASVRGVDELARVLPELAELLAGSGPGGPGRSRHRAAGPVRCVRQLLRAASVEAPVLLVLDDLHWAGKTTLSLLRHVLRGAAGGAAPRRRHLPRHGAGPHPPARRDARRPPPGRRRLADLASAAWRPSDVDAYLAAVGNDDRALGRELAEITSGNPFFLIEVVRHVEEAGGAWEPATSPKVCGRRRGGGCPASPTRPTTRCRSRRSSGTTFDLALVEQVDGTDLIDEIAEACQAGLVVEEPGAPGRFRFAHALVRQVLLAELVTVKRVRLHRTIAELLDAAPIVGDPDARLADLAYHWFECASPGERGQGRRRVPAGGRSGDGAPRVRGGRRPLRDGPPGARRHRRR